MGSHLTWAFGRVASRCLKIVFSQMVTTHLQLPAAVTPEAQCTQAVAVHRSGSSRQCSEGMVLPSNWADSLQGCICAALRVPLQCGSHGQEFPELSGCQQLLQVYELHWHWQNWVPCHVMEAVAVEQKAKEMAPAVGVVSEAARSMGNAEEDTSIVSEAAQQAAAALSSMDQVNSTVANSGPNPSQPQREGSTLEAHERERKKAETESFALGEGGVAAGCKAPPAD